MAWNCSLSMFIIDNQPSTLLRHCANNLSSIKNRSILVRKFLLWLTLVAFARQKSTVIETLLQILQIYKFFNIEDRMALEEPSLDSTRFARGWSALKHGNTLRKSGNQSLGLATIRSKL